MLLLAAVSIAYISTEPQQNISFAQAKLQLQLWEPFLEQSILNVGGKPSYVSEIIIVDTQEERERFKALPKYGHDPETLMRTLLTQENLDGYKQGNTPSALSIGIFPVLFKASRLQTRQDFESLLEHEFRHAEVLHQGQIEEIRIYPTFYNQNSGWNTKLFKNVVELDAYSGELSHVSSLSPSYEQLVIEHYMIEIKGLWRNASASPPELVSMLKVKYFKPEMLNLGVFFRSVDGNGQDLWYIQYSKQPESPLFFRYSQEEIKRIKEQFSSR